MGISATPILSRMRFSLRSGSRYKAGISHRRRELPPTMLSLSLHVFLILALLPSPFGPTVANGLSIVPQPGSSEQLPFVANTLVADPLDNHLGGPPGKWRRALVGKQGNRDNAKRWNKYWYPTLMGGAKDIADPKSYGLFEEASQWKPEPLLLTAGMLT